jgi:hypothetical protein
MFKYFYSFLLTGLSGLALLTGCDDPEPKTRLDFVAGTALTSGNGTVAGGEIITTSLFARSASASNNLKKFIVSRVYDTLINTPVVFLDSTFDAGEFGMTFVFGSRPFQNGQTRGKEYWNFKIIDAQGKEYQKQYTLVTTFNNTNPNFNSFTSSYFYRNARENIRYVATSNGLAYPGYVSQNNPGLQADLDFYFGHEPPLTVNLSALNGTRFKATNLTATEFNGVNTAANLSGYYENAGAETDRQPAVRPNSVIAFKTGKGKVGLIQIGTFEIARDSLKHANVLRRVPFNVKVRK